jgi:DNA-binding MarR family transcriptional regulator
MESPTPVGSGLVLAVIEEAVALHHQARSAVERLHRRPELTDACRGVLRDLARLGPRTVPQLARGRDCSRQHVQVLVSRLVADGMAELIANPDHRRSPLVTLTGDGRAALEAMWRREAELAEGLPLISPPADLERAVGVMRELRRALEQALPAVEEAER